MVIDVTVKIFAVELGISVDYLISQFANLGIQKTGMDYVTLEEKKILLMYMRNNQKSSGLSSKLILQRKTHSTLNVFSSGGKNKKIQIEVRKKHTYVRCCPNILEYIKEGDIASLNTLNKVPMVSNSISTKNNELIEEKTSKKDFSYSVISDSEKSDLCNTYQKEKKRLSCINNNEEKKILPKKSKSNYYKNQVKNVSHVLKNQQYDNLDVVSVGLNIKKSNLGNYDIRKKIVMSNDRKLRSRQRIRTSNKGRSNKMNVSLKNRKNTDYFLEMKYECDQSLSFVRGIKNQYRKNSILTHAFSKPDQVINRDVVIGEMITVSELANRMAVKSSRVIKIMMQLGVMATINQVIDQQTAQLVAEEMGHHVILRHENDLEAMIIDNRNNNIDCSNVLEYRPPIVTVMGHVDHGKTSLLDYIRSSKVADSEAGGITQHIGAYCVEISNVNKKIITFLDTPGHAAFSAMRARGVQITDIVVLVIAVDDGVMLQTIEAIKYVQSAKIPMIVALNKIDKVALFDMNRIKTDLSKQGVISEDWGGETQFVSISAKSGIGIDDLLNAILLESELLELKVIHDGMANGVVIESFLDKGKGPVAIVLIREGTLKCSDIILCGLEYGRVRAMRNSMGENVFSAGPSMPVEVFGLSGAPFAGDLMIVVRSERQAREVALYRQGKFRAVKLEEKGKNKLKNALTDMVNDENTEILSLNIILKADVQGSVEAIRDTLKNLSTNFKIKINIIGSGVGGINETDISLAIATGSIVLGFNVRSDFLARRVIGSENLEIYYYSVIYDLIDGIKKIIDNILVPKVRKRNVALAEVRDIFCLPKLGNIAGCIILEGIVRRHHGVRILRKNIVVHEGELESLRRFKDDVNEVRTGMECGIVIRNYKDIFIGDFFEMFENVDVKNSE